VPSEEQDLQQGDVDELLIEIQKACASHKHCVVCRAQFKKKANQIKSKLISKEAILDSYCETGLMIKQGSRFVQLI
jgi:hypothetical protein